MLTNTKALSGFKDSLYLVSILLRFRIILFTLHYASSVKLFLSFALILITFRYKKMFLNKNTKISECLITLCTSNIPAWEI